MKRRITALMITLCMVLTMMPLHVHATEAGHVHYGGEATCRWKATCEGCGSIYGETDPNNHNDYFGEDNGDGRTHTAMCTCGHIYNTAETHDFSGWEEDGPGQEARFCYECYYTETRSTHTHSYSVATCTTPATCSCNATQGGVDKNNHVGGTEIRGQVNAGEFTEGYTGDTYCLGCGDVITYGVTIPATHTHSYSDATCTTPATCSCNATQGGVDKNNHVGGTEIRGQVNAGEFTEGYTGDTYCLGCGDKLSSGSTIPATHSHSYDSYAYDRNGHWKVCSCGATQAAEGHDWYIYKQDANKHYWRCDCGNNGWGDAHFDNNNTGKCDDCGYEMPHTHSYTAVVTEPTCGEGGYTTYTCSCNDSYVSDYVDALDHDWGDYESDGNGYHTRTCTTDSSHYQTEKCGGGTATCKDLATCSDCGTNYGSLNSTNHTGGTEIRNAKGATEIEDGYTGDTYCLGCGYMLSEGNTIPATGSGDDDDDTHTHNYSYYKYDGTNHWKMCHCGQGQAGSVKPHTLVIQSNNNGHWKECTVCNYYSAIQAHVYSNDSDVNCNDCGYERHVHSFPTATCITPAVCSCGSAYKGKNSNNHAGGTEIRNAAEATIVAEGYTGDTYCLGCGSMIASGEVIPKAGVIFDGPGVEDVTFIPAEGTELPGDAEIIVNPHTPSADNLDFLLGINADTEYLDLDDEQISMYEIEWFSITYEGVTYKMGEYIIIDGLVYFISGVNSYGYSLYLIRTDNKSNYILELRSDNLVNNRHEQRFDVPTNKKVSINGITYDVKCIFDSSGGNNEGREQWMLYYGGEPVGTYFPEQNMAVFHEGCDPATLNAQKNASNLGIVTPGENPIDGLVSGKTYNVSVIGSNDIHLEGAENASGTVTQTFDIPVQFVNNPNVKYAAVHNTNPHATALAAAKYKMEEARVVYWEYHGDSAEERQRLYEAANKASMEWATVQELYDAWEKEHAADNKTGNELGTVTIAEDGKTLTATYTVSSFSPFTVYAFTEAELPEIREFVTQPDGTLARAVNGQPVTTHTVASGENLTVIARKYGCTVDEIVALNSDLIENPSVISVGWVLTIPQ